ncbi:ribonuclease H-like domain-containing protein [Tanacetum coccineum]
MEARTNSTTLTTKLPILNLGDYDLWLMRIEQYFLMTNYSLWEVIKNGNKVLKRTVGETEQEYEPTTAEEKQDKRNKMKARGTLLMALPNKDQLKFHSYKDAKLLMEAIEKRYGGNKESKKVQRTLLKQQYENFAGLSSEIMDQTFDRLQKLISQLEIQGEVITQEDMNLKLLRSLPSEWKTHALIWRNKQEIETISLDDLYNNLKIYEPEISGSSSTSQNPQNVAFVSSNSTNSNSSTNEADNTAYGVSAAHTQSNPTSGDNLSDAVICAFLASQPNSPQLAQEDLEQIDPDDLEEMDLQWEMAMLTIRARRFIKRTCRKLDVNVIDLEFDKYVNLLENRKTKEERSIEELLQWKLQLENALLLKNGIRGSDSEVDSCTKSCVKAYATLKELYDSLSSDNKRSQFNLVSYKVGLESVEARLAHYKKNEVVFEESINVLKLEVKLRDTALVENKKKLEKAEKERDELKLTLEKFQNSSKSLNNLLESQVIDKFKTGLGYNAASSTTASPAVESFVNSSEMLENQEYNKSKSDKGYHAVPLPFTGNFIPRKPDLTFMDEIVESENMDVTTVVTPSNVKTVESNLESAGVKSNGDAVEPKTVRKNSFRPPVIEDWNSDDESEVEIIPKVKTVSPSTEKIKFVKSGKINTAGANVNTAVRPVNTAGSKPTVNHPRPISNAYKKGYSQVTRPFNKYSEYKNSIFNKKVNTVRVKDTTARDRAVGNPQQKEYKEKGVIDSGCSRHMTGNKCYLTEYEDYDGGFVSFGDGKGRIFGKGKIKTGTLDFDNVYFCKVLKYNLFSMSQICDKKNNVLFTDTECLVLSSDFKLLDESQVLMRVPRKDNIYSIDLKSVVPTKGLTCLFAKARIDESNLWHRRLRHINFKNINKLVKGNHDETSGILKTFIIEIENQLDHKVKVIRCDNGTEFKNSVMNQFCEMKGIKREFSIARTPQQNGVAERRNRTLIEAARTMLVDSKLPTTFWAKAVNTACNEMDQTGFFDVDSLTISMNYVPVVVGNQTNGIVGTRYNIVTGQAKNKTKPKQEYILIPICTTDPLISQDPKVSEEDAEENPTKMDENGALNKDRKDDQATRIHPVSVAGPSFSNDDPSSPVNVAEASNAFEEHLFERFSPFKNAFTLPPISNVTPMDDTRIFGNAYDDEDVGAEADLNNLETTMNVSPVPTTRINKDHPKDQIIGDFNSCIQTRRMAKIFDEHAMVCYINKQRRNVDPVQYRSSYSVKSCSQYG